ncbi:hypothetical protein [Erythrobacter sp.]|jgi:hypothetical protein|uniref:hypothetical protein n=1 Tax=Erythrobacter sp. TaxID=1042 RepID=UPI002EB6C47E|nr:hypothetical protein [Erythrobacter sp.]
MSETQGPRFIFSNQLRLEAEDVLEDLIFKRAPVQSRLLRYLVDATIRGGKPPGQYEIAVDALGKDPDFDLANDSYPRVQISRLRTNLDNYYARNKPRDGVRIVLEPGEYRLDLARIKEPESEIAAVSSVAPQAQAVPASGSDAQDGPGPSSAVVASNTGEAQIDPPLTPRGRQWREKAKSRMALTALLGVVALGLASFIAADRLGWFSGDAAISTASTKPTVALRADTSAIAGDTAAAMDEVELSLRSAEIQLAASFISRLHVDSNGAAPDYRLDLDFAQREGEELRAFVSLAKDDGNVLYYDDIRFDPSDPEAFAQDIEAALVFIMSPTGAIASDQFRGMIGNPRSGYECFIAIENQRANGARTAGLVDQCIAEFADSEYAPFFFARRAFSYFQQRHLASKPIERAGQGWDDVTRALAHDRFNAFANFTAAKVELANDNCEGAIAHVNRAFEASSSYPAMVAALEAEASSCDVYGTDSALTPKQLRSMIERNPAPDALLHLYLLIAALSTDDLHAARILSKRPRLVGEQGLEERTIQLLQRALDDPQIARTEEHALRRNVGVFVWGDAGVERLITNLQRG